MADSKEGLIPQDVKIGIKIWSLSIGTTWYLTVYTLEVALNYLESNSVIVRMIFSGIGLFS